MGIEGQNQVLKIVGVLTGAYGLGVTFVVTRGMIRREKPVKTVRLSYRSGKSLARFHKILHRRMSGYRP